MKLVICSLLVLALPFAVARADHPHHAPPQAAFDACAKAKSGDACSVALHDHTMTGVCVTAHASSALVCRPDHPPGPPPGAVDACNGHGAGDTCSVTHGDHTFSGTCERGRDGAGALACRPSKPPHH